MGRRIWIVAKKDKLDDADVASAVLNGCPEIGGSVVWLILPVD